MKKKEDLKDLTLAELVDKVAEEKANQTKLLLNNAVSPVESPISIRHTRRNIARLLTEVNKRKNVK